MLQGSVGAEALTIAAMANTKTYDVHGDMALAGNGLLIATSNSLSGYPPTISSVASSPVPRTRPTR